MIWPVGRFLFFLTSERIFAQALPRLLIVVAARRSALASMFAAEVLPHVSRSKLMPELRFLLQRAVSLQGQLAGLVALTQLPDR